ncbi:MAG: tetratricopeptide repeat protein [Calditrichaeota bacterium]|nr:tetratricopeptide repeat protein [Calditrichota bacterium]
MKRLYSILSIALLVVVVSLMLFGCRSKEVESALIYINQQNDWGKAMEQLKMAVQVNPADVEAHVLLAEGYGQSGDYENMVKEIDTAEKLMEGAPNPKFQNKLNFLRDKYWRISFNKGVSNVKRDSLQAAKKDFENCVLIDANRPESYQNLGYVNVQLKNIDAAVENYKTAVKLNPKDINAFISLTNLYLNQKRYQEAIDACNKILALDPENAQAIAEKAMAYDLLGNSEEAFKAYDEALAKNPNNKDLLFNMGRLYYRKGQYEDAIAKFKAVIESSPDDFEANVNIGNAYLLRAEDFLKKYRDMDEKQLAKHAAEFKSDNASAKEYYKQAIPYLEKAVVLSPDQATGWYNLGVAYVQAGEAKKGAECFNISDQVKEGNLLKASDFIDKNLSHLK